MPGRRKRWSTAALVLAMALAGVVAVSGTAAATVTVSRAELNGSRLRIEGRAAANRAITVDGVALGTSDGSGTFRSRGTAIRRPPTAPST